MDGSPYEVKGYSFDELVDTLARDSDKQFVLSKSHSEYFKGYFAELGAKTIVVENRYVDHDYLEDFTAYYVRCFRPYLRTTRRLHFFSVAFDESRFKSMLRGEAPDLVSSIQNNYLGFIVVKPLPQTVIGRTCLRTYPDDNERRHFPILRGYKGNLFGIDVLVNTIAFQEQDQVVAACATSALWSAFQATGPLFHHPIPSPAEITRIAANHLPEESPYVVPATRGMPNKGLTTTQMAHAIRHTGLEAYLIGAGDSSVLKGTVYAYLRAQIPVILVIAICKEPASPQPVVIGRHAVAVTGYGFGQPEPQSIENTGVRFRSLRINKLYVHDDQVGPFARMDHRSDGMLTTSWGTSQGQQAYALPQQLLIPLYHKIRIPFGCVHDAVHLIAGLLDQMLQQMGQSESEGPEWDIYLTTVNQLKAEVFGSSALAANTKIDVLVEGLPKYVWRASALVGNKLELDLLFDATDIEQGGAFVTAIEHGETLGAALRLLAKHYPVQNGTAMVAGVFSHFAQSP